jgi:hypothetical protein
MDVIPAKALRNPQVFIFASPFVGQAAALFLRGG